MLKTGRVALGRMEEVIFGKPAAAAVADIVKRVGAERVFLMVSGTLNRETDEIEKLRRALGNYCVGTFDAMPPHTPRAAVIAAANQARDAKADLIVTLGGGSITDGAKAVQLCLARNITTPEGMDECRATPGKDSAAEPTLGIRQISVPTTLSAGEFSAISGVTDERSKVKELFRHPMVIPQAVILDPAVTVHTPEWLWLSTGIRAVDHCVEGVCSKEAHPYADAQALRGLTLLTQGLNAVGRSVEPRSAAGLPARLVAVDGTAGQRRADGCQHGIGYILGAAFDVPHGHTSCIMLPSVMRWNKPANADRQAMVAAAMGKPGAEAADLLHAFIAGLGMPSSLGAVKIGPEHFDRIAQGAMNTPWVPRNPRPIPTPAQVREILELAA